MRVNTQCRLFAWFRRTRGKERYVWVREDSLEALVQGKVRVAGRLKVGRYVLKKRIGRVVPEEGSARHGHQSEG